MRLTTPITISHKAYAKRLEKLGIVTLQDFLLHLPHRYDDFSIVTTIAASPIGTVVTVQGRIMAIKNVYTRNHKKIQQAEVDDGTGILEIVWFNQPFIIKTLKVGDVISVGGRIEGNMIRKKIISPVYELLHQNSEPIHTGRLVPVYPETAGVSSKWLRRQIYRLLTESSQELVDFLPEGMQKELQYMQLPAAIRYVHFPENLDQAQKAKERLAFDEVFFVQLSAIQRRNEWRKDKTGFLFEEEKFSKAMNDLKKSLPFSLTKSQQRAIEEIFVNVSSGKPMNRLLEGDVGSGKTIVAAFVIYLSFLSGYQSVLMAPTEILAQQHFATIKKFLEPQGMKIVLQTGSKKNIKNESIFDILIGTHAVLSENIKFNKLGLVVIDEQQRFGVEQRSIIRQKGKNPHLLTMTATPIPRTVALTLYGDLDVSYLDEMPKGRKEIKTWLVPATKRSGAYQWIAKRIHDGDQVFIICPFIEESESMTTVKAATKEFERLQRDIFPTFRLAMLHGKMKAKEKDTILETFRSHEYDILIATPVVEVGIDIPNATVMVIEGAERFGLAGLHQLRGRVGRGEKQSFCLLFAQTKSPQTFVRLKALETLHIGATLAEMDLKFRGSGELYGTQQHGKQWLKIASFSETALIEKAKQAANKLFPHLREYPLLSKKLVQQSKQFISPD
ncbi:MAG TPA: ATP-dependent DNA helicase RecG [Patescibacteria group bacterium]|nr:ATP-dependent DNA helicase RecG [Patescibacteria group bacterium]